MSERAGQISILLVEDDPYLRTSLERLLARHGFEVRMAGGVATARESLDKAGVDVMLVDFELSDGTAPELVRWALTYGRARSAYCMTGAATVQRVVEAMHAGCGDVYEKPFDIKRFAQVITVRHQAFSRELDELDEWRRKYAAGFVGTNAKIVDVMKIVRAVADTNSTVLVNGESGTGKELVARAIHDASSRRAEPFVPLNCAAIPENLIEDELFGHAKGAFTNAVTAREGRLMAANGGTIFLDEIGDMPMNAQAKLLRVLQERRVTPVGADKAVPIDVRVVAATNKRLEVEVEKGTFRGDLYFRLGVIPITLPPLHERPEDVLPLAAFFLTQANEQNNRRVVGFDDLAERAMIEYAWPGNVRELANTVERAVVIKGEGRIGEADLRLPKRAKAPAAPARAMPTLGETLNLKSALDAVERQLIEEALERTGGNRTEAAALLGLNRTTLVEKIRKFA